MFLNITFTLSFHLQKLQMHLLQRDSLKKGTSSCSATQQISAKNKKTGAVPYGV